MGSVRAQKHAIALRRELESSRRIDLLAEPDAADPRFHTDYLLGPALGQMFGVLECQDSRGKTVVLRAFSGQYNGVWKVPGWAPPVFDLEAYHGIMIPGDRRIKDLGRKIEAGGSDCADLKRQRKALSQSLMKELHDLYQLTNFRGGTQPMADFFGAVQGIPTGAGDCCAPKLLNQAARLNLHPLGLAEFYWGASNRSGTRKHGHFYDSCGDRCQPILGFMLCGVTA
ncbi:MAG: hypothetical protein QNL91_16295 [Candidatus Krumholzibacteria bacterium]|nr:hypothetical protein [Candidatus Krumholzibacteria bacterium]